MFEKMKDEAIIFGNKSESTIKLDDSFDKF